MLYVSDLPTLNAALNATSAVLLSLGYYFIRKKAVSAHKRCMLGAFATSTLFLISYLTYHYHVGSVRFDRGGWIRSVYFTILISHTILAAAIVPLVLVTLRRAWRARFDKHKRIARWTLPLWLYVSVTGVVIYWMLYG
jgi:putative membrane protein